MFDQLPSRLQRRIRIEPAGCWVWTGATTRGRSTYGIAWCSIRKTTTTAHRVVYAVLVGPIPDELDLDHRCKTPLCVNPRHVEAVSPSENHRRERRALCRRGLHPMVATNMRGAKRECIECNLARKRLRDRRLDRSTPNPRVALPQPIQLPLF